MEYIDLSTGDIEVCEAVRKYKEKKHYTYTDYESLDDGNRYELIDGVIYLMAAPSMEHQRILIELSRQLANFLVGKSCKIFVAPCDVCLNGLGDDDDTVVQPDIFIVCDEAKIETKYCNGAPDMTIEILSQSTARHDLLTKLMKYIDAGVREYWIVDPEAKIINVYNLENENYVVRPYKHDDEIDVNILDGCIITLSDVFE